MTDSIHDTPPAATSGADAAPAKAGKPPARQKSSRGLGALGIAFVLVLLLAIALGAGAWYLYQQQQTQQAALTTQVQQSAASARQAADQVQVIRAQLDMDQARIQQLESNLESAREQVGSLEEALQMMTQNGGELALLNDIDQLVTISHQQLTLSGNVANAIIALETAQARLARAGLPALAPLQQAVNGDLERLRAVPTTDISKLQIKLDELNRLVSTAPLLVRDLGVAAQTPDDQAGAPAFVPEQAAADAAWWEQAWVATRNAAGHGWQLVSHDLRQLVSVRRIDDSNALLISADQAAQLRDNLRLRLMMAKLGLMMRQAEVWQAEIQAVETIIQARYDLHTVEGKRALVLASQLAEADIAVAVPDTLNSQQAVQALREAHAGDNQPPESPASYPEEAQSTTELEVITEPAQPEAQAEGAAAPASPVEASPTESQSAVTEGQAPQAEVEPESAQSQQVAS